MQNEIYFNNNSWNICIRVINPYTHSIDYQIKNGYRTELEAKKAKEQYDMKYEEDMTRIQKRTNMHFTFSTYIDYWLKEDFYKTANNGSIVLGTWAVENVIKPHIKHDMFLYYVTPQYINEIINECKSVCDSAGQITYRFIRRILASAFGYGYIPTDIRKELIPIKRKIPKIQLLTYSELEKMLQEASKHPAYYFEILLALFCGLRSGEIRGLRYEDFNKEEQTIHVQRQYTSAYTLADVSDAFEFYSEEKAPKANSYRFLKVPFFIFDELEKRKKFNAQIIQSKKEKGYTELDEDYVCISCFGKRKGKSTMTNSLKHVCHYAGIPAITMHTLRHQFATMLLEEGSLSLEYIAKLMGHKSPMTTFSIYCDIMEAKEQATDVLQQAIPYSDGGEE